MRSKTYSIWLVMLGVGALSVQALTVASLKSQLTEGAKVTIVDVRSNTLFVQGHISGAINIPAALCSLKNLPPLGKVVVCGTGLGSDAADSAAATALAGKPGLLVEVLEGGYAAWEGSEGLTTSQRGLKPESPPYISYAQLKAAKAEGVTLVDMRHPSNQQPLTDLAVAFPGFKVSPSAVSSSPAKLAAADSPPLLVLIDNGDGSAVAMARTLQAGGTKRCAILAGGEIILARQGQAGSQRVSAVGHSTSTLPAAGTSNK